VMRLIRVLTAGFMRRSESRRNNVHLIAEISK
jgi:hypothetical protein